MTNFELTDVEARVLGALIEKDITTPDYYPLSLNALVNACNQKSNRDPVMELNEEAVRNGLYSLQVKGLAGPAGGAESRVNKYEHRLQEALNLNRRETAVLCVLLLRGPQTPGELRGRTERLHRFEDLEEVQATLQRMIEHDPPLAAVLTRQPGTKEARYAHLLSGEVASYQPPPGASGAPPAIDRITRLEEEVGDLRRKVSDLEQQLDKFRRQFE